MGIFDKFDKEVNLNELKEQVAAANDSVGDYEEVPAGQYIAKIEKMELGTTKTNPRPMFKVQMRLVEGVHEEEETFLAKYKKNKPCIFMNRVIYGTKNDGNMISSVVGWLNKIGFDTPVVFEGYDAFAELILDLAEDCQNLEFEISYDPDEFNSITINEVFDA